MKLTGLHLLLTYRCNRECDHCFVWGSPRQAGTMTLSRIHGILEEARALGTIRWVYFEGGEAFLYYPVLLAGVRMAADRGFRVGIVTNGYWATDVEDALEWLRPLAGLVDDLSISHDAYHGDEGEGSGADPASRAARQLGIPTELIRIAQPETVASGEAPAGECAVRFRGRAAVELADRATPRPWSTFTSCPYEELRSPQRLHVDPDGHLHVCQGISIGNLFRDRLTDICRDYDAAEHPVAGPLLAGGPAGLARQYGLARRKTYADACHFCYEARVALRKRFARWLGPDAMYGILPASGP